MKGFFFALLIVDCLLFVFHINSFHTPESQILKLFNLIRSFFLLSLLAFFYWCGGGAAAPIEKELRHAAQSGLGSKPIFQYFININHSCLPKNSNDYIQTSKKIKFTINNLSFHYPFVTCNLESLFFPI